MLALFGCMKGIGTAGLGVLIRDTSVIVIGLLQLVFTFIFGLGWFWALFYSILLVLKSVGKFGGKRVRGGGGRGKKAVKGGRKSVEKHAERAAARVKKPPPVAKARKKTSKHKSKRCRSDCPCRKSRRHR